MFCKCTICLIYGFIYILAPCNRITHPCLKCISHLTEFQFLKLLFCKKSQLRFLGQLCHLVVFFPDIDYAPWWTILQDYYYIRLGWLHNLKKKKKKKQDKDPCQTHTHRINKLKTTRYNKLYLIIVLFLCTSLHYHLHHSNNPSVTTTAWNSSGFSIFIQNP